MNPVILNQIPFQIDLYKLLKKVHIDPAGIDAAMVQELAAEALEIAKPKAMYRTAHVGEKGADFVIVDGVKFTSRIMRVNFEEVCQAFPYVATCGMELYRWYEEIDDVFWRFVADTICDMALDAAMQALFQRISQDVPGQMASMNPGSLQDWPIEEQKCLFELLGGLSLPVGVRLEDSFLMTPVKSISGIRFPSVTTYENCQLCPRRHCPGRRAPYDSSLYIERYA